MQDLGAFCRDCGAAAGHHTRCPACGSPRLLRHPEVGNLSIAHVDCDAFFATIEKRDDPSLRDKPVIIGGGKRGVVSTACYIARINGVRSAMPMFKALKLCPNAVVIKPNGDKYSKVGREVRHLMQELTPLVQPVSIDEAFLDLSGTQRLHGMAPAQTLARFARRVEAEIGITVSVGLSYNKFLAKIASDLDKPRGFAVIGRAEAKEFLGEKPVSILPGIGKATEERLAAKGIRTLSDVRRTDLKDLARIYGNGADKLLRMALGEDDRPVRSERDRKSVSAETTFDADISEREFLEATLWRLSERVARRLRYEGVGGASVTLKLKTPDFRQRTRATLLPAPTRLAKRIFDAGRELLRHEPAEPFRLIGIGVADLHPLEDADPPDLVDTTSKRHVSLEGAEDRLRDRFGDTAVTRGTSFALQLRREKERAQRQSESGNSSNSTNRPSTTKVP
ncbi:DNA polymerase IV 1 [Agaricicola taiwanensis]|uniref:DNA polymerase IV n=1 Tax=Agaricicola taiwanensis TaxID=591372 RepID=A0A8J2YJX7_9RHOB|nr:DNA polymerase IV [Agaricicola taiwanensis]GGE47278.1 DNA polymerase IV 1 [Agaricicola taiwanensis]